MSFEWRERYYIYIKKKDSGRLTTFQHKKIDFDVIRFLSLRCFLIFILSGKVNCLRLDLV